MTDPFHDSGGAPLIRPSPFLIPILLSFMPGCDPVIRGVTEEARPLVYVGSVTFGEAVNSEDRFHVPITMGPGPWQRNSGQFPTRVTTRIQDRQIDMTIHFSSSTEHVELGLRLELPQELTGEYEVFYLDPNGTRHCVGKLSF